MNDNARVIYEGPSQITGKGHIVGIVTGLARKRDGTAKVKSTNTKLAGDAASHVMQLFILNADEHPSHAVYDSGNDEHICGSCPHKRGNPISSRCYVRVEQAPRAVWQSYADGNIEYMDPRDVAANQPTDTGLMRLGAYGDPAALPFKVLRELMNGIGGQRYLAPDQFKRHTGYTHQWMLQHIDQRLRFFLMASVESECQQDLATSMGWRTFRVVEQGESLRTSGNRPEIACPASKEQGYRLNCVECGACNGERLTSGAPLGDLTRKVNVMIEAH
mgnify:FL=1|tara:strand:- start:656 stop:1480 length:825 start_codon:yes stop_codon:yes gene_type:complete